MPTTLREIKADEEPRIERDVELNRSVGWRSGTRVCCSDRR